MDERSQHGYPPQPQHAAPWPSHAPSVVDAPINGHAALSGLAPPPLQTAPSIHQFHYAASGYVLPGSGEAHGNPLSAHGGTIGVAQPHVTSAHMLLVNDEAIVQPHAFGAGEPASVMYPMLDAAGQPQAWAFPTPNGLQLVQTGSSSTRQGAGMHAATHVAATGHRVRWETIIPALAVLCLIAAIGLFARDFDRNTGRDAGTTEVSSTESTRQVARARPAAESAGVPDTVAGAGSLFAAGRFDDAAEMLHPMLGGERPDPAAAAMHGRVDAASARDAALLRRLAVERVAGRWAAAVTTIDQIEQLRPLDRRLVSLRTRARSAAQAGRSARLRAAADARAAAKLRRAGPSNGGPVFGGGSRGGRSAPPVAGGNAGASSSARPPADVPRGSMPVVPDLPNPVGANPGVVGSGQAAATMCAMPPSQQGGGANDGQDMC